MAVGLILSSGVAAQSTYTPKDPKGLADLQNAYEECVLAKPQKILSAITEPVRRWPPYSRAAVVGPNSSGLSKPLFRKPPSVALEPTIRISPLPTSYASIAASPTGVGGGVLGLGAAGAAAGAKVASLVSIGAYGYDYLSTGRTSSAVGVGAGLLSLVFSGLATKFTAKAMQQGRMFGDLSAPQQARLDAASAGYGSAAGAVENVVLNSGC